MQATRRKTLAQLLATLAMPGTLVAGSAHAQTAAADWPTKPVRLIVPAPAGGAYDRSARPLAQELQALWKQPVVVENKPGAGNIIGTQAAASAAPDGHTLVMTGMVNTIAQGLYDKLPFDIVGDFAHATAIGGGAQWLVVNGQAGIASFADLVEQARRAPGKLMYATSGQGSTGHLLMELLQRAAGIQLVHVPYKGGAPALQDVLAGQVPITVIPVAGAMPHIQSGKLKVLAISSAQRAPELPAAPTFAELGHKGLTVSSWIGLSAPKGTPAAIVAKVHAGVKAALAKPELLAKLEGEGMTAMVLPPDQYTALVRSDTERWGELTRSLGLKAQ
jgi:tripartite-type tricarboxylate transporter receptor subunit TctC